MRSCYVLTNWDSVRLTLVWPCLDKRGGGGSREGERENGDMKKKQRRNWCCPETAREAAAATTNLGGDAGTILCQQVNQNSVDPLFHGTMLLLIDLRF